MFQTSRQPGEVECTLSAFLTGGNKGKSPIVVQADRHSVFLQREDVSDVTFMVEEKELHFCKAFLRASSPVFERMFTSDFKEKHNDVIPLPGKTVRKMDIFLQQLHPVHCWKELSDDQLSTILCLADEYQVEHIRLKCQKYIEKQLASNAVAQRPNPSGFGHFHASSVPNQMSTNLSLDQQLLYLGLCDRYHLGSAREVLISLTSSKPVQSLESNPNYQMLPLEAQKDLFKARCVWLEKRSGQFQ